MQKSNLEIKINFCIKKSARAVGFEPTSRVLETRMLPLHHARVSKRTQNKKPKENLLTFIWMAKIRNLFCFEQILEKNKFNACYWERNLVELMTNLILNERCTPILQFTFVK
jgi:hypothetical protein